jgi:hypothetical protein
LGIVGHRPGRRRASAGVVFLATFLVGCSTAAQTPGASASPVNASPSGASLAAEPSPSTSSVPGPSESSDAASPIPSATPVPTDASGCPVLPADLATVRDVAKADRALACFGRHTLTVRAYVPTTDGLGGVSGYRMTPAWIADPFTGVIVQPGPLAEQDQDAWLIVRIRPALGTCAVTGIEQPGCPLGRFLDEYVTLSGHFDDSSAAQCRSRAWTPGDPAGPSRSTMVATCRRQFVVTAIAPG